MPTTKYCCLRTRIYVSRNSSLGRCSCCKNNHGKYLSCPLSSPIESNINLIGLEIKSLSWFVRSTSRSSIRTRKLIWQTTSVPLLERNHTNFPHLVSHREIKFISEISLSLGLDYFPNINNLGEPKKSATIFLITVLFIQQIERSSLY